MFGVRIKEDAENGWSRRLNRCGNGVGGWDGNCIDGKREDEKGEGKWRWNK